MLSSSNSRASAGSSAVMLSLSAWSPRLDFGKGLIDALALRQKLAVSLVRAQRGSARENDDGQR